MCSVICLALFIQKLTHCLALLPKSKGDEESWSVMMQKILILINDQLNLALQGLEEGRYWRYLFHNSHSWKVVGNHLFPCIAETMRNAFIRLLVLPGKQPPPPLGGYISTEEANNKETKRSEQSLMSNVSILLPGCCMLLTNTYPVKVLFSLLCSYSWFCVFLLIWETNVENWCDLIVRLMYQFAYYWPLLREFWW